MKPIKLKKTTIDIPFLNEEGAEVLVLKFDRSDENIEALYRSFDDIQEQGERLESADAEVLTAIKEFLEKTIDTIFGEGSFDKLYELSPSVNIVAVYFAQMAIGIKEELEAEDISSVESKYLK